MLGYRNTARLEVTLLSCHHHPASTFFAPLALTDTTALMAPNQLCMRTRHGRRSQPNSSLYSGLMALTLSCPLPLTFALALFPALTFVASSRA